MVTLRILNAKNSHSAPITQPRTQRAVTAVVQAKESTRSKVTKDDYGVGQRAWAKWCTEMNYQYVSLSN